MSKKKQTKKKPKKYARTGKILTKTVYAYVEPANHKHAIASGKKPKYGTTSAYVNALIAADRGAKPAKGTKGQVPVKKSTTSKSAKRSSSKATKKTQSRKAKPSSSVRSSKRLGKKSSAKAIAKKSSARPSKKPLKKMQARLVRAIHHMATQNSAHVA